MRYTKFDTAQKIAIEADRMMNRLDREYLNSKMSEDEYEMRCAEIVQWEDLRMIELKRAA